MLLQAIVWTIFQNEVCYSTPIYRLVNFMITMMEAAAPAGVDYAMVRSDSVLTFSKVNLIEMDGETSPRLIEIGVNSFLAKFRSTCIHNVICATVESPLLRNVIS